MPPQKTKELRSFRVDADLLRRLDALSEATGEKKVDIVERALDRELTKGERATKAVKPPLPDPA